MQKSELKDHRKDLCGPLMELPCQGEKIQIGIFNLRGGDHEGGSFGRISRSIEESGGEVDDMSFPRLKPVQHGTCLVNGHHGMQQHDVGENVQNSLEEAERLLPERVKQFNDKGTKIGVLGREKPFEWEFSMLDETRRDARAELTEEVDLEDNGLIILELVEDKITTTDNDDILQDEFPRMTGKIPTVKEMRSSLKRIA
ncbi:hypothetical protein TIFTF001_030641 [Ficus carica]|uniref:Uncharacterized protein n=1 Tax=Ficus carica TaxID=3494 RepID=A0AA88DU22_FICCA|nr:hypothetical protein TIFTF001_030641 [Ficus carica]